MARDVIRGFPSSGTSALGFPADESGGTGSALSYLPGVTRFFTDRALCRRSRRGGIGITTVGAEKDLPAAAAGKNFRFQLQAGENDDHSAETNTVAAMGGQKKGRSQRDSDMGLEKRTFGCRI